MKLGLFSDIHAEIQPLERTLKLLEKRGADRLLCMGDLVDGDTEGEAAAQRVKGLSIPVVMGNHDQSFAKRHTEWGGGVTPAGMSPTIKRAVDDRLSADTIRYLASLPKTTRLDLEGMRLLLAHGSPWDVSSYIFPSANSYYKMLRVADEVIDADVVLLGHTHVPMAVEVGGLWIFNPGSVERNRNSLDRTCAVLELPAKTITVYDIDSGGETDISRLKLDHPR